jgi:hypothetical protein
MRDKNTCTWFEYDGIDAMFNGAFCIGTREEFLEYVKNNNVPFYRPIEKGNLYWVPFGLYRVRLNDSGFFTSGEAQGFGSGYVADKSDFLALAYAITGETDIQELRDFIGSNPYKTACRLVNIKPPRYLLGSERTEEEDNMFTRRYVELNLQLA